MTARSIATASPAQRTVETIKIGQRLQVGLVLNELLCAPMQQANVGVGALDHLSIQLKNQPQNAVLHSYTATKHESSSISNEYGREGQSCRLARRVRGPLVAPLLPAKKTQGTGVQPQRATWADAANQRRTATHSGTRRSQSHEKQQHVREQTSLCESRSQ